jgi:SAM-dependent methyltransferase/GNAT superfamily N-acetyltransferase
LSPGMPKDYEPVEIDPRDRPLLEKIGRLRVLAWSTVMPDAARRAECWLDEFELQGRHWCIFHDGEPVAAARMSIHERLEDVPDAEVYAGVFPSPLPPPIASINRLVTHPEFRGRGFSWKLDNVRVQAARAAGASGIIGENHTGMERMSQLARLGFQVVGDARSYPSGHFFPHSGLVIFCDLRNSGQVSGISGIHLTTNRMGWSSDVVNEISQEFIRFVAECNQPVLDIGAGFGVATVPALAAGATVIANDLSPEHVAVLVRRTPAELRGKLTTIGGRFPDELDFPEASLAAVHASQVLHFLTGDEIEAGLAKVFRWLRPGGRLFVLAGTPFSATHQRFVPEFLRRKAIDERWPGWIERIRDYNSHWSVGLLPDSLHVFDDDVLSSAVQRAGFADVQARMFSRTGLPDFCRLDGRENLGLTARKPTR